MLSVRNILALALTVAVLSACTGSGPYSAPERSGSYGTSGYNYDDDRGPQARNANSYMRQ